MVFESQNDVPKKMKIYSQQKIYIKICIYLGIIPNDGVINETYRTYNNPTCRTSPIACWFEYGKYGCTSRYWSLYPAITVQLDYRVMDDCHTDQAKRGPLGWKSRAWKYHRGKEYFSKDIA
jgi:hypothetical protein